MRLISFSWLVFIFLIRVLSSLVNYASEFMADLPVPWRSCRLHELCTGVYSPLAFVLEVLDDLVHGYAGISSILHISQQFVLYGGQHCTHSRHPVRESETRACGNQLYSRIICTEHYGNVLKFFPLCVIYHSTLLAYQCVCVWGGVGGGCVCFSLLWNITKRFDTQHFDATQFFPLV